MKDQRRDRNFEFAEKIIFVSYRALKVMLVTLHNKIVTLPVRIFIYIFIGSHSKTKHNLRSKYRKNEIKMVSSLTFSFDNDLKIFHVKIDRFLIVTYSS